MQLRGPLNPQGCFIARSAAVLVIFIFGVTVFSGFASSAYAGPTFFGFVQKNHRWKADLDGWQGTARILEKTLVPRQSEIVIDAPPQSLADYLTRKKGASQGFRILYFASHLSADGKILFSNRQKLYPNDIIELAEKSGSIVAPDLVIIDCCFAATFRSQKKWMQSLNCPHLFCSTAREYTWQIEFNSKQPLWVEKYYPATHRLAYQIVDSRWDGKMSYLGFQIVHALSNKEEAIIGPSPSLFLKSISRVPYLDERIERARRSSSFLWHTLNDTQ